MITSEKYPSTFSEKSMDRTGFEPASRYLTGNHATNYTTGPSEF